MHERIRAPGRSRSTQPTSEAWHELSRFVSDTKAMTPRRMGDRGEASNGDRNS
jgi:hypothetical protein